MKRRSFLRNTLFTSTGTVILPSFLKAKKGIAIAPFLNTKINVKAPGEKLVHFWSKCVGAGRANEGLRASWLEQMKLAKKECGFRYCRFHGLFHDDMFVFRENDGQPVYNWQYIDDLFDRMLDIGVKPFVELAFMPKDMAAEQSSLQFWWKAHACPPKDFTKWGRLVTAFTKHCISRYGLDEVKTWYFEVWNEPNLKAFWNGTKSQYFELYKTSALAIKTIDKDLKVGGPATSNFVPDDRFAGENEDKTKHKTLTVTDINTLDWKGVWIEDFLDYCKKENLPLDFISTHPYPTDWAIDPETKKGGGRVRKADATLTDMQWLKKTIAKSAYPKAEIHLTEWSSSPSSRDAAHDSLQAAAYIIKANLECIALADSLSYWTFTDVFEEAGAGNSIFHGGFGLINYQGIIKPSFHAYRMLNALGDTLISHENGMIVTRDNQSQKVTALLYHYPEEMKGVISSNVVAEAAIGKPKKVALDLTGTGAAKNVTIQRLNKEHGFAWAKWKAMGSPEPPNREQVNQLKDQAFTLQKELSKTDAKGHFTKEITLQPWECVLIQIG